MDSNLSTAIVSASGSLIVAIVAILANNKRIDDLGKRMEGLDNRVDRLESSLIKRIEDSEKRLIGHIDIAFTHMELLLKIHEAEHHKH